MSIVLTEVKAIITSTKQVLSYIVSILPNSNPTKAATPSGAILEFIEKHYKSWDKFKETFETSAMKIQGSGWIYLSKDGKIKTIVNHEIKQDILLLIDWWEHAFNIDYRADKAKYLANQWKIIDWDRINIKLEGV